MKLLNIHISLSTKSLCIGLLGFELQVAWALYDQYSGGPCRRQIHLLHERIGYLTITRNSFMVAKSNHRRPAMFTPVIQYGKSPWPSSYGL